MLGSRMNQEVKTRLWLLWLGVLATLMLIYASLIPLRYRPLDWPETIQRTKSIPWLQLSVYNRADWIANGLVVVPVAFLLAGALSYRGQSPRSSFLNRILELGASGLVLAFLFLLIGGIEISQIWFPPRTVSWNDILAGWIGAIAGVALWLPFGCRSIEAARRILGIQRFYDRLSAFALLACIAGFLYSIYPLDFVLSRSDWSEKLRLGRVQWGLVPHSVPKLEWGQGLLISVLRAFPFGLLGSQIQSRPLRWIWVLGIALFLELIQHPVFS
jgi:VanZ family protein